MTLVVAVVLCVASSVAYTGAALLQRQLAQQGATHMLAQPRWWGALVLNGAGGALHVAALRFGPLLLVQPFGLLTLVLAVVVVALRQRRPVTGAEWRGLALTCGGLAGLLLLIDTDGATAIRTAQLPYLLGAVVLVLCVVHAVGRTPRASNLWAAGAAGVSFGVSSALAQTVTLDADLSVVTLLIVAAMGVLALAGVHFTQVSFRRRFAAALATSTLTNPIAAAVIGFGLLGEGLRGGVVGDILGLMSAILAAGGITLLAPSSEQPAAIPAQRTSSGEYGLASVPEVATNLRGESR